MKGAVLFVFYFINDNSDDYNKRIGVDHISVYGLTLYYE